MFLKEGAQLADREVRKYLTSAVTREPSFKAQ